MAAVPPSKLYIAVVFAVLNVIIGALVAFLKLPIYLDSLGIVLSTLLLGWRWGLVTAVLTLAAGFFYSPYLPFYALTAVGIVCTVAVLYRVGLFNSLLRSCFAGLIVASVSAVLSAPVTAYLGGNTLSGVDAITTFLLASGQSLWSSVFIAGFTSEPVDKVLVCVLAYLTATRLPRRLVERNALRPLPRAE